MHKSIDYSYNHIFYAYVCIFCSLPQSTEYVYMHSLIMIYEINSTFISLHFFLFCASLLKRNSSFVYEYKYLSSYSLIVFQNEYNSSVFVSNQLQVIIDVLLDLQC